MKVAHLILAHKNPHQLERLINAMSHPGFHFYIHLDKKTREAPFAYLFERADVFPIRKRTKVYWAGWGTIQATINGFQEILPKNYDYINVISAQDFPLKPPDVLFNHLKENKGTEFITCESIDDEWKEAAPRIREYHLVNWRIKGKLRLQKLANRFLPPRKFPFNHTIVGRANWFTLTREAVRYSLDCIEKHPKLSRYYKYCWGADEFIFSTILYNSPFREWIRNNLVYVDWATPVNNGHPRILTIDDLGALKSTDKFFARKFDQDHDSRILDELEAYLLPESTPAQVNEQK